ncbi:MAG TPA: sialidase family protein [Candidatus Limnocylindrales bacterium]|nr:sialidase family protein [Candidatus Limnocylindrales bacterium]
MRGDRLAVLLALSLVASACGSSAPSTAPSPAALSTLPPPPDELGLGWVSVLDVERPPDAFEIPEDPSAGQDTGTSGHPLHFPGQAMIEDVVATPDGLVAIGYVGFEWRPVAWHTDDPRRWALTEIGRVEPDEAAFAVALAVTPAGEAVAVGRAGRRPAVWRSGDGGRTWRHTEPPVLGSDDDWERMTAVAGNGTTMIAGGSVGPELLERRARFWTSGDGGAWQPVPDDPAAFDGTEVVDIVALPAGGWLAIGRIGDGQRTTGSVAWTSGDGRTWLRQEPAAFADARVRAALVRGDGSIVAVGSRVDETMALGWVSRDGGATWTLTAEQDSLRYGDGWKIVMTDVVEVDGGLVAVGNVVPLQHGQGMAWRSRDGLRWERSPVQPALGGAEPLAAVAVDGSVIAVGTAGSPDNFIPRVWISPPGAAAAG